MGQSQRIPFAYGLRYGGAIELPEISQQICTRLISNDAFTFYWFKSSYFKGRALSFYFLKHRALKLVLKRCLEIVS